MSDQSTPEPMGFLQNDKIESKKDDSERQKAESTDRKLMLMSLRVSATWIETLRSYFAGKGLDLSSGIRLWIGERMEHEGLK